MVIFFQTGKMKMKERKNHEIPRYIWNIWKFFERENGSVFRLAVFPFHESTKKIFLFSNYVRLVCVIILPGGSCIAGRSICCPNICCMSCGGRPTICWGRRVSWGCIPCGIWNDSRLILVLMFMENVENSTKNKEYKFRQSSTNQVLRDNKVYKTNTVNVLMIV